MTGIHNAETKCEVNFLQKSKMQKCSAGGGENANLIKSRELSDSKGERRNIQINAMSVNSEMTNAVQKSWKSCRYCGEKHKWGSRYCSAYGKVCRNCGKRNHVTKVCRSSGKGIREEFDRIHQKIADMDMRFVKVKA